jgi:GT2 family glycosyltransferase
LRDFDHPRVGAVAIPFVNVNESPAVLQKAPQPDGIYAAYAFIGTAHALRRDLFLQLGGYREVLFHQSEEEDYCLRMLQAGYVTRAGNAEPIHHFESPRRSWQRMDYYGARNKVLYAWHNIPFPYLPLHLTVTTIKTSTFSFRPGRLITRWRGVVGAYAMVCTGRTTRQPVSAKSYELSRSLKLRGPLPLTEIESDLPTMFQTHH